MNTIKFSYNWNNKLNCNCFTTIRIANNKYKVGETYDIYLKDKLLFKAQIIEIKPFRLDQINEFIARLDTGYSKQETTEIIKRMYKNPNVDKLNFYLILLKNITNCHE